ncbi:MAG: hypothetical protein IJR46_03145 [Neisseriaceae bacterium]|nr:hypothetical protein [Neisseriaceae bacterium]
MVNDISGCLELNNWENMFSKIGDSKPFSGSLKRLSCLKCVYANFALINS